MTNSMFLLSRLFKPCVFKEQILGFRNASAVLYPLRLQSLRCMGSFYTNPGYHYWSCDNRKYHSNSKSFSNSSFMKKYKILGFLVVCLTTSGITLFWMQKSSFNNTSSILEHFPITLKNGLDVLSSFKHVTSQVVYCSESTAGSEIHGLPTYTADEVSSHDSLEKRIWVCYKSGVYDITEFTSIHPGGDKILMAAGGALEPFWEIFAVHKDPKVLEMLETYRIGNLRVQDRGLNVENANDPFANDPRRHPVLKPRSVKPFNAEPPPELLVENFVTPNEIFFVRNHLPVPEVDPNTYELEISGINMKPIYLTLKDLKTKYQKHTIMATVQCAGNRRSELNMVKEVKGLSWGSAAISNAQWSGVKLVDILKQANVDINDPDVKHVQFEGLDTDPANLPYGASIPAEKALDPKSDVLLAYEMNGQELPRDHGYPVRVVAPGIVGARNVKWLGKIILSDKESDSHWQKKDYKGFSPSTNWDNVDFNTAPAIQDLPVNSAVCKPANEEVVKLKDRTLSAAGYAWSGGGRKIVRVDVSVDDGKSWRTANLVQDSSPLYHCWSWTLWQIQIPVPDHLCRSGAEIQIICKAIDSSYNVQPDTFDPIWNLRGVLGNAWHRIKVKIE